MNIRPVLLLLVFAAAPLSGLQETSSGIVTGTVTDASTGAPLEAASVHIPALGSGVLSNAEGSFRLVSVPAGSHELHIDLIGYASVVRTIAVTAGETLVLALQMNATALMIPELVVTGTAFEESPLTLPYAVAVSGRRTLAEQGTPETVDFFRNLGASHGVVGERQSWYNANQAGAIPETVSSVNLRGLGPSRTLVLLNSRRQVYMPARLAGGRFVDLNSFPSIALDRIEVLKEGASAVYGSDAVAGVVNFITRSDFEGLEASIGHEYIASAGDSDLGAIWGKRFGDGAHLVISSEARFKQALRTEQRDWALRPFTPGGGAWSYTGNPGAFYFPRLTGGETREEFVNALIGAHGDAGTRVIDPNCANFGGHLEPATCRFRYQPWDNLIEASRFARAFAELNGEFSENSTYHVEALWAQAVTPAWLTTPSFPPISPYDGLQVVEPHHPGRQQFCRSYGSASGFGSEPECLDGDWYFYGRLVGNSGPGRELGRASRTQRIAASLDHQFEAFGDRSTAFELAASYSRSSGNVNQPAEYAYRKYLAFRGFGGPDCGVGVVADPNSPSGMSLGALGGASPGQGACKFYNPFSSAHQFSRQPGSAFYDQPNPDYAPGLANDEEMLAWINEEVDLDNAARMFVADATLKGELAEFGSGSSVRYAAGYQFRTLSVSALPNRAGDLTLNPCPVPGDTGCATKTGPYTFTTGYYPYDDAQSVHRLFVELPMQIGSRVALQAAGNYEFHGVADSFDPKLAVRFQLADPLVVRASVQTTFRAPSVDDVNEERSTSLEYVSEAGVYKAVDTFGDRNLKPERATTYNLGLGLQLDRMRASVDYWSYDFRNVIEVLGHSGVTRLYAMGGESRRAVQSFITCPDGPGTGTCDAAGIERIRVQLVNWPGIETSGIDWHFSGRVLRGAGIVSFGTDGTFTRQFQVRPLTLNGAEVQAAEEGAGNLNWGNPIAPPLPQVKSRFSLGYHRGELSAVTYVNAISSYTNQAFTDTEYERIDSHVTLDLTLLRRAPGGWDAALSAINILDRDPPLVNWEQSYDGFTHSVKGRRIELSLTWRPRI